MFSPYTTVLRDNEPAEYDLTVVTVCRNVLASLKRTTASVLGQKEAFSDTSVEHIVVDGASTDGTAEWLEKMKKAGKIEAYVSEPDRGIYDAMNKGINMARGRVLLFLNADDVFTHVDLSPCLAPILSGKVRITAAVTRLYDESCVRLFRPSEKRMYIVCPICHQAFFAATSLYRELGGYRAELFRCAADTDFMYRAIHQEGFPPMIDATVTDMPLGGFSHNCAYLFCDEFIALLYNNKEELLAHCRRSPEYASAIAGVLLKHCMTLRKWQLEFTRDISARLIELQELCREIAAISKQRVFKEAMFFAAESYLATLMRQKQCTLFQWFLIRRYRQRCELPASNPYYEIVGPAELSLRTTLKAYLHKFRSLLHHVDA